ncbi:class I adenylate-forming enzyme family protein [Variovorax sp. J31P207]|uniref:class I adenylate-forming enzyme family protein n=1 Tax=Variovorax sp. J31P207 TaxID=3053510 RepID=UPI0025769F06|nr:class I adenylate-forming enzyme family protein [Variovorax sp. J31P207]MDM0066462.1 class I adenylate-forming enzyme family protein [Variovorax sp. J31P207]
MKPEQQTPRRVHELLDPWVAKQPNALALRDAVVTMTYGELDQQARLLAARLQSAGVRPGDRVLIVGENCVAMCVLFLALSRIDAWTSVVNARLTSREIAQFITHSGARRVLYLGHVSTGAQAHAEHHGAASFPSELGDIAIGPLAEDVKAEASYADPSEQVAAMVYTSGTTGSPKGVMLTHSNMAFVATSARDVRNIGPGDVVYGVLPMAHVVGLSTQFLGAMSAGAALLLEPRFTAEGTIRALAEDGVTIFTGVPALFARMLEWARQSGTAIHAPRLRLITVAGSPLTPSLKAEVEREFKLPLQNGYGLTETSPTIAQTGIGGDRADCSVGPPIPGVDVRIVDAAGDEVAPGEVGELWARGPGVMKGYYKDEALTATVINSEGWFNTGDMARCGPDGALFISGRTKELIIRSGFNVYPVEVEQVLNAYPAVVQSAVVGREVGHNEEVVAFVETRDGFAIDMSDLRSYLRGQLSPYKQPTDIRLVKTLPSAPNGKVLKHVLRELAKSPDDLAAGA